MNKYWIVGVGGFIGSIARFWLGVYVNQRFPSRFPFGTFVVNMSGSFLIGLVVTVLAHRNQLSANWLYLVPVGFIGAYTTFSTFELEALRSVRDGQLFMAFLNVSLSVIVGFVAVWLGMLTGRAIG